MMNKQKKLIIKLAVLVGIVVLPLIYSITYLKGFWDPYNNLGDMNVAVVNLDRCDNDCKGDELFEKLKESDSFNFSVHDEKEAEEGLHNKDYYAIITIPSDFTASFENASSKDRSSATITYRPNNKTNYIASQLINNALMQVQLQLQSEVSSKVVENLTDKLNLVPSQTEKISDGLGTIANGTNLLDNGAGQLLSGANTLDVSYTEFDSGVNKLNDGIKQASDGINTLTNNSSKIKEGISTINSSLNTLQEGTYDLQTNYATFDAGIKALKNGISELKEKTSSLVVLGNSVSMLKQGSDSLDSGLNSYKVSSDKAYDDASLVYNFLVNYLENYFALNPEAQNDASMMGVYMIAKGYVTADESGNNGLEKLKMATSNLISGSSSLNEGLSKLEENTSSIETLLSAISSLDSGASTLETNSSLINEGIGKVNSGTMMLYEGMNTLNTSYLLFDNGMNKLNNSGISLVNGSQVIADSSDKIKSGINTLDSSVSVLKNGTSELTSGVTKAKAEVDAAISSTKEELTNLEGLDKYTSAPVKVKTDGYGDVNDYGTFFSPFFMSLSLWLGSLLILIGLYYDPDNRFEILGRHSKNRPLRLLYYIIIGIIQAVVLGTVLKVALGFDVTNIFLFYGSCILISLAFLAIMMFLFFNFGDVGKFIAIVLLVVQLAACGGTFPLEVEPNFFRVISPYMPMTYSV
ncbi:MAG: YhgE/Pip domain-containing protein, partial [Bacilli bacterium]|nr:YhgE/Pip domain-containing protein [Bacilli bacterium]